MSLVFQCMLCLDNLEIPSWTGFSKTQHTEQIQHLEIGLLHLNSAYSPLYCCFWHPVLSHDALGSHVRPDFLKQKPTGILAIDTGTKNEIGCHEQR